MEINALHINHFRGFKQLKLDFSKRTTVFVGINGVGKTALLDCLAILLSHPLNNIRIAPGGNLGLPKVMPAPSIDRYKLMNAKTRERAMRVLLSSLLESNLSVREMTEISDAFMDDREFPQTFGQLIKDIVISMENKTRSLKPKPAIPSENDETPVKTALFLIKKKRLLKNGVLERLGTLSPDIQAFIDKQPQKRSLTDILNNCYNEMPQQFNEFLDWLRVKEVPYDDYLEGILQKE